MPAITDTAIRAALKRAADSKVAQVLKDPAQVGLELRVAPSGTRTWRFQYRTASGPRRHTLGAHSDQLGLAQARIAARSLREEVREGERSGRRGAAEAYRPTGWRYARLTHRAVRAPTGRSAEELARMSAPDRERVRAAS